MLSSLNGLLTLNYMGLFAATVRLDTKHDSLGYKENSNEHTKFFCGFLSYRFQCLRDGERGISIYH